MGRFTSRVVSIGVARYVGTFAVTVPAAASAAANAAGNPTVLDFPALLAVLVGLVVLARTG